MSSILDDLKARARKALACWALSEQEPKLLKYRENAVFRVELPNGEGAALRLHRPGYHSEAALRSELLWMDDLRNNGLDVPRPIPAADGSLLVALDRSNEQYADLIGWVDGQQIGESGKLLEHTADELARIYRLVGASMAEMHNISDRWSPPASFTRSAWDRQGLLGESPLWGRFWDCPGLSTEDRTLLAGLRIELQQRMDALSADLDYGLIHADLVRENVLVNGDRVALIDFDDSGYGYRLFEIATALLRNRREPHYPLIVSSLIEGYRSKRSLSDATLANLPLFLLLRSLTYIGWAGERSELPDAGDRLARYIRDTRELAQAVETAG
ncbi:phosphotransferase [Rhizobium sp. KVB221]|uniref:Phosphotransferase n=1 Tax=Rhizobium setariae TaxID=2801340 RepID=A0A937CMZ6_9HYPH|nr:phosphotransferase [Rhizobium setariae]MBL0373251.1 phosphotransferase [Rhizobium setariae]